MSDTMTIKVDSLSAEIATLKARMNEFSRAVEMQRRALRQLQMTFGNAPQTQQVVQNAVNASNYVTNAAQQIASQLPIFDNELNRLRTDIDAMHKEHNQLRALSEVGAVINSTLDPDEVLNRVMDKIIQITGAERGYLMLRNNETGELEFKVARNMDQETMNKQSFQVSRTIVTTVAETGEPVVTTNAQSDPRFQSQESVIGYSLRSILCVPLQVKGNTIGVVYADNRIRAGLFGERELGVLTAFANQAAVAIDNARLFASVANQKKLMDDILRSITSGVITTDTADKITLFNRAAESILGTPTDTCVGATYTEVLKPLKPVLSPIVKRVKEKDQVILDLEAEPEVPKRGKINLSVNLSPLKNANEETQGVAIVVNDITERKRFEKERAMVTRYLPTELVDQLADIQELRLGGTRETVSILFGDIRGFTTYSESHAPEQVVDMINHYYNLAARIIRENDGIVDKYEGDCVMAHFGTPLHPIRDHAWKAVKAAWEIQQAIRRDHNDMPVEDRLSFGIGINTGEAVAGNVGGEEQMDYTLIGDAVNLSKRLQENAGKGVILLGESTFKRVQDMIRANKLEPIQVKGRTAYEQVYEVTGIRA